MNENRKSPVIALRAAAVLLVLVLMTTSVVSGRYARYTSTATGSDRARVAKYAVTVTAATGNQIVLDPNSSKTVSYDFSVTSGSEVAVEYDLTVVFQKALPEGVVLSLTREDEKIDLTHSDNTYTAKNAGTFNPRGGTHAYTLTFTAEKPVGADTLESIAIRVDARQVD